MLKKMSVLLAIALASYQLGASRPTVTPQPLGVYLRTVGELRAVLADRADTDWIGVAVGKYEVAPLRADLRTLSLHCGRAGWWDNHVGGTPDAEVVVPGRIDVQLGRDAGAFQRQIHEDAVLRVGAPVVLAVVGGVGEEDRRRVGRDPQVRPDRVAVPGL